MKSCVGQNCQNRIVFVCKCKETPAYSCEAHVAEHLKKSGTHNILPLIVSLDSEESDKIIQKVIRNMQFCRDLEQKIQISIKAVISHLMREATKAIEIISELEKEYSGIIRSLVMAKEIDKEENEKIAQTPVFDIKHFPIDTK